MRVRVVVEGKTLDTGDDCFTVRLKKSFMAGCVHKDGINVWGIYSAEKGDMKKMLNAICKRFGKTHLLFTSVLNTNLIEKLSEFKPKMVFWDRVGEEMICLEGEWRL